LATNGDKKTYFMFNAQVHTYSGVTVKDPGVKGALAPARPDLAYRGSSASNLNNVAVEGGQYYTMAVSDWNKVFSN
jgi:hypothetical protein